MIHEQNLSDIRIDHYDKPIFHEDENGEHETKQLQQKNMKEFQTKQVNEAQLQKPDNIDNSFLKS